MREGWGQGGLLRGSLPLAPPCRHRLRKTGVTLHQGVSLLQRTSLQAVGGERVGQGCSYSAK